jgi:hypothetical protein
MAGTWFLARGPQLCVSNMVRRGTIAPGEERETRNRAPWADGMPEITERWYVASISRNGWIRMERETRPAPGHALFEPTGEALTIRSTLLTVLVALGPDDHRYPAMNGAT